MPSRFVLLERWPLDLNGKVDRKALVAMTDSHRTVTAPRTPTEQLIAEAFCRALGVAAVGATDDFFELGGDSLKAVEVGLELSRRTGSELALGAIQHAPSVDALARLIDGTTRAGSLVPLQPRGVARALFCVHAHMGHAHNLRELARQFAPERPFYGLQARGLDGIEPPETRLEAMAAAYVGCVREVQPRGPYLLAGYCFGSWVALEMARKLRESGDDVAALLLIAPDLPPRANQPRVGMAPVGARLWARLRSATPRRALDKLRRHVAQARRRARTRLLWHVSRVVPPQRWPLASALRKPADAIEVMVQGYRPRPYAGQAVVLVPADVPVDLPMRQAWEQFVLGRVDFVPLAGNSTDLLRQPYVRGVAACMMAQVDRLA